MRAVVNALLHLERTRCGWRNLPDRYPNPSSVRTYYDRCRGDGTWGRICVALGLAAEGDGAQIELRASWSPTGRLAPHAEAWAELVGMLAGLPPGSEDIAVFGARRTIRD